VKKGKKERKGPGECEEEKGLTSGDNRPMPREEKLRAVVSRRWVFKEIKTGRGGGF